jgi:DNA repair exonuclease SbcCD ATPase subunit
MAEMKAVSEKFASFTTPGNEAQLKADLENYRDGYLKHLTARLQAQSRVVSSFIAGPSNFPVRQMEKRNSTLDRRTNELLEWREKALNRLNLNFNPVAIARRPIRSDEADAIEQLQAKVDKAEKLQTLMKAANRIVRKKTLADDEKVDALIKIGTDEKSARKLLEPDFAGRTAFPSYRLTNNNANIKRMKTRIATLQAEASRPEAEDHQAAIDGTPVTIIENKDEGRIQLVFEGKPPQNIIDLLNSRGFNWSRNNGAWQRLLNDNARRTVNYIIDK